MNVRESDSKIHKIEQKPTVEMKSEALSADTFFVVPLELDNQQEEKHKRHFENFKRYLLFQICFYHLKKINQNTQIRPYRKSQIEEVLSIIHSHPESTIYSLAVRITTLLKGSPGYKKRVKRVLHGREFPDMLEKALEHGQNPDVLQMMNYINISAKKMKDLLNYVFEINRGKNKVKKIFSPKETMEGNNVLQFKRYILIDIVNFLMDKTNIKSVIAAEDHIQAIIQLLNGNSVVSIDDVMETLNFILSQKELQEQPSFVSMMRNAINSAKTNAIQVALGFVDIKFENLHELLKTVISSQKNHKDTKSLFAFFSKTESKPIELPLPISNKITQPSYSRVGNEKIPFPLPEERYFFENEVMALKLR